MMTVWVTLEAPSLCQSEHLPHISIHIWFLSQMPLEEKKKEREKKGKKTEEKEGKQKGNFIERRN